MPRTINVEHLKIPVVAVVGLIMSMAGYIWYASAKSSKVDDHDRRIGVIEQSVQDFPTRPEFNDLKDQVKDVKGDTKQILQLILDKKIK